jgi:hypothetical protein
MGGQININYRNSPLTQAVYMLAEAGLQVRSVSFVNDVAFENPVNDAHYLGQFACGFILVGLISEVFYRQTHTYHFEAVLDATLLTLTDSFLCRLMMCHMKK